MVFQFGKSIVKNLKRVFANKRPLTKNAFLNYLRFFKSQNPFYSFTKIVQDGSKTWMRLQREEQRLFSTKYVLSARKDTQKGNFSSKKKSKYNSKGKKLKKTGHEIRLTSSKRQIAGFLLNGKPRIYNLKWRRPICRKEQKIFYK